MHLYLLYTCESTDYTKIRPNSKTGPYNNIFIRDGIIIIFGRIIQVRIKVYDFYNNYTLDLKRRKTIKIRYRVFHKNVDERFSIFPRSQYCHIRNDEF